MTKDVLTPAERAIRDHATANSDLTDIIDRLVAELERKDAALRKIASKASDVASLGYSAIAPLGAK